VLLVAAVLAIIAFSADLRASAADQTLLVTVAPGRLEPARARIDSTGARVLETLAPLPILRASVSASDQERVVAELRQAVDLIQVVEVEGEQVAQLAPNDSLYRAFQWNLRRIGMEKAWDLRPSAADVIVGVLDTGVDLSHPDLRQNLLLDLGYNFLDDNPTPQDDESHGTAVAGIIGAVGNNNDGVTGIAWRVKLLPIKALNAQGRGPDSAMVKAILHAADHGA
jgi:subtilisin family serine protease